MDAVLDAMMREFGGPEIPLAEPPSLDLSLDVVCPCCGSTAAAKKEVEDACIGDCPSCCTEFALPAPNETRQMIVAVAERFDERLEKLGMRQMIDRRLNQEMTYLIQ